MSSSIRIASVAALVLSVIVAGFCSGFEKASHLAVCVVVAGETGYQVLANHYFYIAALILCFLGTTFIKKSLIVHVVSIIALVTALVQFADVYSQKKLVLTGRSEFTDPMREFIVVDIFVVVLLLGVLICQVIVAVRDFRKSRLS